MVVNNPHNPKIGDYVKPRYNKEKFIETYIKFMRLMRLNQNASLISFEEMYSSLISKNFIFQSFTYDNNLCKCFTNGESMGWVVPIQCLKRVKV